jgi:hypothetical protein
MTYRGVTPRDLRSWVYGGVLGVVVGAGVV